MQTTAITQWEATLDGITTSHTAHHEKIEDAQQYASGLLDCLPSVQTASVIYPTNEGFIVETYTKQGK